MDRVPLAYSPVLGGKIHWRVLQRHTRAVIADLQVREEFGILVGIFAPLAGWLMLAGKCCAGGAQPIFFPEQP